MSEPAYQVDLTSCDREPIHQLGHVQPFGAMLVVSHDDAFLHSLGLTDWLRATEDGWCSRPA